MKEWNQTDVLVLLTLLLLVAVSSVWTEPVVLEWRDFTVDNR